MKGKVYSLNISQKQGEKKKPVEQCIFIEDYGIQGDIHAGLIDTRQVSLLSWDRIKYKQISSDIFYELYPGDFAENITTEGIDLLKLNKGDRIRIKEVILEVSQIGKKCHTDCQIYKKLGWCIMPKEGIFARVIKGGEVKKGDEIEVMKND
jgi:MOSC domain-containing protein YiiM